MDVGEELGSRGDDGPGAAQEGWLGLMGPAERGCAGRGAVSGRG